MTITPLICGLNKVVSFSAVGNTDVNNINNSNISNKSVASSLFFKSKVN